MGREEKVIYSGANKYLIHCRVFKVDHSDGLWQTSDRPGHVLTLAGGDLERIAGF